MSTLRFGDLPGDMSELDYLGFGAFFPSAEPMLGEMNRTQVMIIDPQTGATIDCRGVFDLNDLDRFLGSYVTSVELRSGAGALLFAWDGLRITMAQVLYASDGAFIWEEALGGADAIHGSPASDTLLGYGGDDTVTGGAGADSVAGGAGADLLDGGDGADSLDGSDGADGLLGGGGDDRLWGGAEADSLQGDAGQDQLDGGDGDDLLTGGAGDDFLSGGTGNDIAAFAGRPGDYVIDVTNPMTGALRVTDQTGGNGIDTLDGIEALRFGDHTLQLHLPPASVPVGAVQELVPQAPSGRSEADWATLADGTAVLVWREFGNGSATIRTQAFGADLQPLSAPMTVYTSTTFGDYAAFAPSVTALSDGGFAVAWTASFVGDAGEEVLGRVFGTDGTPLTEAFAINPPAPGSQRMPQLAGLADGGFVAVWESPPTGVVGRLFDALGRPTAAEFVLPGSAGGWAPEVAALPGGGFVVAWDAVEWTFGESPIGIAAQRYDGQGLPAGDRIELSADGNDAWNPAVSALAGGGFVLAWTASVTPGQSSYDREVRFQRFGPDGAPDGGQVRAAEASMFVSNAQPALAATDDGGFFLAWEADGIRARRFDALGSSLGPADFTVGPPREDGDAMYGPVATRLPDGDIVIGWTATRWANYRILAQRYDHDWTATRYTTLEAGALDDELHAGGSATRLDGGAGNDSLHGSPADDWLQGGAGNDWLFDGTGNDRLEGGTGDDSFRATPGDDTIDGGEGVDAYFVAGRQAQYLLTGDSRDGTLSAIDADTGTDRLRGIERLSFDDFATAWDLDGIAGKAYRLYKAAFDRTPDTGGLGYWIRQLDDGAKMINVASGFVGSKEFRDLFGQAPDNAQYTRALYLNVLDREPDATGYAYWNAVLDGVPWNGIDYGRTTREQMLIDFAESAENQMSVINLIADGITYVPWVA